MRKFKWREVLWQKFFQNFCCCVKHVHINLAHLADVEKEEIRRGRILQAEQNHQHQQFLKHHQKTHHQKTHQQITHQQVQNLKEQIKLQAIQVIMEDLQIIEMTVKHKQETMILVLTTQVMMEQG